MLSVYAVGDPLPRCSATPLPPLPTPLLNLEYKRQSNPGLALTSTILSHAVSGFWLEKELLSSRKTWNGGPRILCPRTHGTIMYILKTFIIRYRNGSLAALLGLLENCGVEIWGVGVLCGFVFRFKEKERGRE